MTFDIKNLTSSNFANHAKSSAHSLQTNLSVLSDKKLFSPIHQFEQRIKSVRAGGGANFVTQGPTKLTVGDNPGGMEYVQVIPISGKGQTTTDSSGIHMAGGGAAFTQPDLTNLFGYTPKSSDLGYSSSSNEILERLRQLYTVGSESLFELKKINVSLEKGIGKGSHKPGSSFSFFSSLGAPRITNWISKPPQKGGEVSEVGKIAGGGLQEAGSLLSKLGPGEFAGNIGGPISGLGKFVEVVFNATERLKQWTNQLHEGNMQFAEFSGSMAKVQAEQTIRDIQLSNQRGERLAKSAGYLAEGKNDLDVQTSKIVDVFGNVKNYIAGFLSKGFATLLKPLGDISDTVNDWFNDYKEDDTDTDYDTFINNAIGVYQRHGLWKDNFQEDFNGPGGGGGDF